MKTNKPATDNGSAIANAIRNRFAHELPPADTDSVIIRQRTIADPIPQVQTKGLSHNKLGVFWPETQSGD